MMQEQKALNTDRRWPLVFILRPTNLIKISFVLCSVKSDRIFSSYTQTSS